MYKLTDTDSIIRTKDGASIPKCVGNRDYDEYQKWLAIKGNTPTPTDVPTSGQKWAEVRSERDRLLTATDWTQLADSPLTSEQVARWATYRQELREVPQANLDPDNVIYPTRPA